MRVKASVKKDRLYMQSLTIEIIGHDVKKKGKKQCKCLNFVDTKNIAQENVS